jgi:hypothetical protein
MGIEPGDALTWVSRELGDTAEGFATCVLIEVYTDRIVEARDDTVRVS